MTGCATSAARAGGRAPGSRRDQRSGRGESAGGVEALRVPQQIALCALQAGGVDLRTHLSEVVAPVLDPWDKMRSGAFELATEVGERPEDRLPRLRARV